MASIDHDHTAGPATPDAHPLGTAAIIIYATFALLVLAVPQSLVNRLDDLNENPVQQVALHVAEGVQAASHALRLDVPYQRARAFFLAVTGKEEQ
jgi:hypothetical protein